MAQMQKYPNRQLPSPYPILGPALGSPSLQGHLMPFTTAWLALSPARKVSSLCYSCSIPKALSQSDPILPSTTEAFMHPPMVCTRFLPTTIKTACAATLTAGTF